MRRRVIAKPLNIEDTLRCCPRCGEAYEGKQCPKCTGVYVCGPGARPDFKTESTCGTAECFVPLPSGKVVKVTGLPEGPTVVRISFDVNVPALCAESFARYVSRQRDPGRSQDKPPLGGL